MILIFELIKLSPLSEQVIAGLLIALLIYAVSLILKQACKWVSQRATAQAIKQVYITAASDACGYQRMNDNLLQQAFEQAILSPHCWKHIISDGIGEKEERVILALEVFPIYLKARNSPEGSYRVIQNAGDLCDLELLTYNRVIQAIDLVYESVLGRFNSQHLRERYEKWLDKHTDTVTAWKDEFSNRLQSRFVDEMNHAMEALVPPP